MENTTGEEPFHLTYPNVNERKYVTSQDELAVALNCSRRTIAKLMKEPGNPGKTQNGSYPLAAWQDFYDKIVEEIGTQRMFEPSDREQLAAIRVRRDLAIARREELLTAKLEGRLVELSDVKKEWREFYSRLTKRLRDVLLSIPGFNPADAEQKFTDFLRDVHEYETELTKSE